MTHVVLLGAGASVDAGVPGAKDMTSRIVDHFGQKRYDRDARLIRFAVGGLLLGHGARGDNPLEGVDVEDLFAAVEFLGRRESDEIAPFVGTWHSSLTSLEQRIVSDTMTREEDERERREQMRRRAGGSAFGQLTEPYDRRRHEGQEFKELATNMLRALSRITVIDRAERVDYLVPLARHVGANETVIATLNYDNSIELAAESIGMTTNSGIEEWERTGRIAVDPSTFQLLKLHGSINWRLSYSRTSEERPIRHMRVIELSWDSVLDTRSVTVADPPNLPGLVFGARSKLRPDGPFLALLRAFADALAQADLVTVIGYSFRDAHINNELAAWINGGRHRRMRVVDLSFEQSTEPFSEELRRAMANRLEYDQRRARDATIDIFAG